MREDRIHTANPNAQAKPPQFGLRSIFVVTAMVAVLVAGIRFGGLMGTLVAVLIVATVTLIWAVRSDRDIIVQISVCLIVASSLFLLAVPIITDTRVPSNVSACQYNLKQIGLALLNYHDKHGRFPPAVVYDANGKPMHSWRTLILPEVEEGPLFQRYRLDEPWDSPHNKSVTAVNILVYQCPSDDKTSKHATSYVALIAPGSIWSSKTGSKASEITDGDSRTLVVIEMKNSGIHWAEPRDLDLDNLPPGIDPKKLIDSLSPHAGAAAMSLYADGHVDMILSDAVIAELKAAVSKSEGNMADFEKSQNRVVPIPSKAKP